jgi:putative ABC transport system substrate-binding protein
MRRREFTTLLGGAAVAWPLTAPAQQKAMPVIGYLNSATRYAGSVNAFQNGLAETGYHDGQNVVIEYRWAEGHYDRLPALAAELVRRPVDVIVASGGSISALAAKAATNTIPIVFLSGGDPVKIGLAASLSRPGGNATGVAQLVTAVEEKSFELLRKLVPTADTIAYLENPTNPNANQSTHKIESAAGLVGVKLFVIRASSEGEVDAAFTTIVQKLIGALLVGSDSFFFMRRDQLAALSARDGVATMYFFREFVEAGGLISYGTRLPEGFKTVGAYTGKILSGAKPADLPIVQQSEKIELIVNLKAANALGLTVPQVLLVQADEVIE